MNLQIDYGAGVALLTMKVPYILGISASHNGAACLLKGEQVVVAVQEERLTRIKRTRLHGGKPSLAIRYCLQAAGIQAADIDLIAIAVQGHASDPVEDIRLNRDLYPAVLRIPIVQLSHHHAHAISAFTTSGFRTAAVLVVDGSGSPSEDFSVAERSVVTSQTPDGWEIISGYYADCDQLTPVEKHVVAGNHVLIRRDPGMPLFRSLGAMFEAASVQIFGQYMEAGKVMGLAPYGKQSFPPDAFLDLRGSQLQFFDRVPQYFQDDQRWPLRADEYQDLAHSTQIALETALLALADRICMLTGESHLCYAGGTALNSVANEKLMRSSRASQLFVVPAAEDSGAAIGAAYYGLWQIERRRTYSRLNRDEFGAKYDRDRILAAIHATPRIHVRHVRDVLDETVQSLCAGDVVAWFQGGSELGPRSLGQRSILFDPRRIDAKDILNARVKHRESFRPFAPVCLLDCVPDWFESGGDASSPFMLRVLRFRENKMSQVPGVVHIDGTGRLQSVSATDNGLFYALVKRFHEHTGVPLLLNTSLNIAGEPIVETPEDALLCMLSTGVDVCVLGEVIAYKDTGYSSLLDLYPVLIAKLVKLELSLSDHGVLLEYPDLFRPVFTVVTNWGEYDYSIPSGLLWLLRLIDGRLDGHSLYNALKTRTDLWIRSLTDQEFIGLLLQMARAQIISFRASPCAP